MSVSLEIKVVPSSGRQTLTQDKTGSLKCFLKSAPEKNKANQELISFLSKKLKITKNNISISYGETSRKKRLLISTDLSKKALLQALGLEIQHRIE